MIREDMARCRDAIQRGDLRNVQATVAAVERRCRRLIELAKNEVKTTEEPMKSYALTTTISKVETGMLGFVRISFCDDVGIGLLLLPIPYLYQ